MEPEPIDNILAELQSDDWLEAASAIRKLVPHGEAAAQAMPVLFKLTQHDKAPIASDSCALIRRLGKHAVPYLRQRLADGGPDDRAMAITLLAEAGGRRASTTRLAEQQLEPRQIGLPDWGNEADQIIEQLRRCLHDDARVVRFAAASVLEEFEQSLSDCVTVFIEALDHGSPHQQNWAALHLGRIGPPAIAASPSLKRVAQSDQPRASLAATNALRQITRI